MVSSFYSSNQQKLKTYTADRRVEERNGDIQQAKVYQQIAKENQDIEAADRLAKLGMKVLGNVAATEVPIVNKQGGVAKMSVKEHIISMIEAGSLSNWWEAIKRIPPSKLSKKARIVQNDIKHNQMLKDVINEKLRIFKSLDSLAKYPGIIPTATNEGNMIGMLEKTKKEAFIDEIIKTLTGGDTSVAQELDDAASVAGTTATDTIQDTLASDLGVNTIDKKAEENMLNAINTGNWKSVSSSLTHDTSSILFKYPYLLKKALNKFQGDDAKNKLEALYSKLAQDVRDRLEQTS